MSDSSAIAPQPRAHYGWTILVVAFVSLVVAAGIRSAPSVLLVPLETEFGWTRAAISLPISIGLLFYGLAGPLSAGFMERFGVRTILVAALILIVVGFAPTPFVSANWQLMPLWGILVGSGTGTVGMVLAATIANRWFVRRRGLVMGLLTGATAAGQLIFLPLLANIVVHVGWRWAVLIACVIAAAMIPVAAIFMRDRPSEIGLRPYGAPADTEMEPLRSRKNPFAASFAALGMGLVSRDFWLLSGSFFVCGASTIGLIGTHFIAACLDHGIPEAAAAGILAGMGVFNFLGTTFAGWLSDRWDSRYLLFWLYVSRGISLLFLPYAFDLSVWGLSLFGLFYGLDWIATVPPTVRLASNTFGIKNASMMYGWIMVCHQIGAASAAYFSGLIHTLYGDYFSAFIVGGLLCFAAALLVLRVGTASRNQARPILATAGSGSIPA